MEFVKSIATKYNVPEGVLRAAVIVHPFITYTPQEVAAICNENKVPVLLPEQSLETYTLLMAKKMRGMGSDFVISESHFKKYATFKEAGRVWKYYSQHVFDELVPTRLYINNVRVDFTSVVARRNVLRFEIEEAFPKGAEFNHLYDKSIFINGTLYNVSKVQVHRGGLVFLWTTP